MTQPVLDIQQLHLSFSGFNGDVHALNNVSLKINRGEIVGLVGESGSGKSVTAMLIMRLLPTGSYCVHRGHISLIDYCRRTDYGAGRHGTVAGTA